MMKQGMFTEIKESIDMNRAQYSKQTIQSDFMLDETMYNYDERDQTSYENKLKCDMK